MRLAKSTCAEGTVLAGLNIYKNGKDPVALADDAYPEWLWELAHEKPLDALPTAKRLQKLRGEHIKQVNAQKRK